MRSLYSRLLLWSVLTLAVTLGGLVALGRQGVLRPFARGGPFAQISAMLRDDAVAAWRGGGREQLASYFQKLERHLPGQRILVDDRGRDLLTGEDRSALVALAAEKWGAPQPDAGEAVMGWPTSDGKFTLLVRMRPRFDPWMILPPFLLTLCAVLLLSWGLWVSLVTPLRRLSAAVESFGRGELTSRVNLTRRDEIGDLARRFDEMAARIEDLVRTERRLLEDVSHELRSPLARLRFAAELAKTAEDREYAGRRLSREIDRLCILVNTLVEVTRAEAEPSARQPDVVPLDELLKQVADDCTLEASAQNCGIALEIEHPATLRGNSELLRRAVENVVRNAIRYAPCLSMIELRLRRREGQAEVLVRDFGPGVPEAVLDRIFDPFFRADGSRNPATGGVGLGLSIARRAVAVHHGSLRARNSYPGLSVTIELPLAAA